MKIRNDFVTNSSSSSFVIAFKGLPNIDEDTITKYPFLESYQKIVKDAIFGNNSASYETTETEVFENLIDLRRHLFESYGYGYRTFEELCKEDSWVRSIYKKCVKKMEEGYKILTKNVGYGDYREDLFYELESDDFVVLLGEHE